MLRHCVLTVVVAIAFAGCGKATTKKLALDAAAAMGGVDRLRGVQTLQMSGGKGTRLRYGQTVTPGDAEQAATLDNLIETIDFANGRAALDYGFTAGPFTQHRQEVLTKKGSSAVGLENVEGRPLAVMSVSGLFSWATQNSPEVLLRRNLITVLLAATDATSEEAPQSRELNGAKVQYGRATLASGESVGLYVDDATKLVSAFETTDTETMLGDVPALYALADYREVAGVKLPHKITITKGAQPYAEAQFASASINDQAALAVFAIPDAAQAEVDTAIAAGDYSPITLAKVASGVFMARAYSHHSLVVEFPTFLAVVEAPYTEAQSKTLIRALQQQFANKPLRYVAPTHHHYDHIGGLRGLAATGATVLAAKEAAVALRAVLDAPHTNPADDLDTRRKGGTTVGTIEAFEGTRSIVEGSQRLDLVEIRGNPHADPKVLGYVPSARILFQSDIWIPGVGAPAGPDAAHLLKAITEKGLKVDTHVGGHGATGPHAELVKAVAAMKPSP